MLRIDLSLEGLAESIDAIVALKFDQPPREPLADIGQRWAERFRQNVRSGRTVWPPRSPISERIRPGSLMNVSGRLLQSIDSTLESDNKVSAGSPTTPKLAALAFGSGQSQRSAFPGARTPARPWAVLEETDVDAASTTLLDWYMGRGDG